MNLFRQFHANSMAPSRALLFSTQALTSAITPLRSTIMRAGYPNASIIPVLENWVQQDRESKYSQLQEILRDLRSTRRFNHALQMLQWMGEKGGYELSSEECGVQLELTSRVHGIEQVEMYFDTIPNNLRGYGVYFALLSSYAHHRCLGKAEATMQKLCELGFLRNALPYNIMLSLYYEMREVGYADDMDFLAQDMRKQGIYFDKTTYNMLLKVYGENLLIKKMRGLVEESGEDNLNYVHHSMIRFLSGNNDMDGAERFWERWLSKRKEMDFRIPGAMIRGYGRNGQWEKAEGIVLRMRESGIEPVADTIYSLASAYNDCNQMDKAVEALRNAISMSEPGWIPKGLYTIADCFKYLESQGNDVAKEELYKMLKEHCGMHTGLCDDLKNCESYCIPNGYLRNPRSNLECGDAEGEDEY